VSALQAAFGHRYLDANATLLCTAGPGYEVCLAVASLEHCLKIYPDLADFAAGAAAVLAAAVAVAAAAHCPAMLLVLWRPRCAGLSQVAAGKHSVAAAGGHLTAWYTVGCGNDISSIKDYQDLSVLPAAILGLSSAGWTAFGCHPGKHPTLAVAPVRQRSAVSPYHAPPFELNTF
jgi:hypothetical protein